MKGMACKLVFLVKRHPLIACFILLLFTPPIFPMVMFFWPLIVSTALGVLAVISFGRQGEHTTDNMESAVCTEDVAFPSQDEKISKVLMVGNQEVTWLEWLHNEDTQKLRAQECEQSMFSVWDADGCDVSSFSAGESIVDTDTSMIKETGIVNASRSIAEDATCVSALVLAEARADLDGIRVTDISFIHSDEETKMNVLSLLTEDASKRSALDTIGEAEKNRSCLCSTGTGDEDVDATEKNAHILTAEDEIRNALHTTEEDETMQLCCDGRNAPGTHCRNAIGSANGEAAAEHMKMREDLDSVVENETDANTPACADGGEGQASMDGLSLTEESENVVNALVSGVGDVHLSALSLLGLTIKDESETNSCASSTSANEVGTTLNALLSTSGTESRAGTPDLSSRNMTNSVMQEKKDAERHRMHHIYDQDEEERSLKQLNVQAPQWVVSDDVEENKSSLRFSFFHNGCLIPTSMDNEYGERGQPDKSISLAGTAVRI